ncbi:OmpA family protein [Vibrio parahaemolyticus]|uniref:OmpA family protein n=1 Tax=Vibrio parahaemolyticus TaxID=670 RepID=UPI001123B54A|nr:OmpA family protein [Vibrio parahaemolyticus]TOB38346.1 hypothetical protein CGK06_23700 [Vibrio parahaemolyticus]TOC16051.1 hypothetical protein CGJ94_17970 [Vibrio parahaemolyticus]
MRLGAKVIIMMGAVNVFAYAHANESIEPSPFWYVGANVATNNGHLFSKCGAEQGLEGVVDGLNAGYQFTPYLATELEYQYLGCMTMDHHSRIFRQGVLSAKLSYPTATSFTPYLKLGGSQWFADGDSGLSGVLGGGLSYHASESVSFNAEYQYTNAIGNDHLGDSDHHRISLGIQYRFGRQSAQVVYVDRPVVHEKVVKEIVEKRVVTIKNTNPQASLFDSNSSVLNSGTRLLPIVKELNDNPELKAMIVGYTDSTGSRKYNLWLSERRALSVKEYLAAQGIDQARLFHKGKGEDDPIASNETESGRSTNRRVAFELSGRRSGQ